MKTKMIYVALLFNAFLFAQSKFSISLGIADQFIGKDRGFCYESILGYNINNNMSLNLSFSDSELKNKELDFKYKLERYAILVNYDFLKSEKINLESIFGFSYLIFDKKIVPNSNKNLGIDLGLQTSYKLSKNVNFGIKLLSTYSNISPGAMLNSGVFIKKYF